MFLLLYIPPVHLFHPQSPYSSKVQEKGGRGDCDKYAMGIFQLANSLLFFAKSNGEFAHIINTLFTLLKKKISVVLILLFESDMHFPVQGNLVCTVRLNL